ncbi:hypothetical protein D9M70_436430 [compost metagenome]
MPDGWDFQFRPLWQLTDTEKADIGNKDTTSIVQAYDSGIVSRAMALKEMRQSSQTTGLWSNITDEDIKEAENDPPPGAEDLELPDANDRPEEEPQSGQDRPGGA